MVYEGERALVKDNHLLGSFDLKGIPPAPRGTPQIEVTFNVDTDGTLEVTAHDKATSKKESITITNDTQRFSKEEIDRMINEAAQFSEQDKLAKEKVDARHQLENYIYSMRNTIEDKDKLADKLSAEDRDSIKEAIDTAHEWLNKNLDAEKEDFEEQMKATQRVCDPIIRQVYNETGQSSTYERSEDEEFEDL